MDCQCVCVLYKGVPMSESSVAIDFKRLTIAERILLVEDEITHESNDPNKTERSHGLGTDSHGSNEQAGALGAVPYCSHLAPRDEF